MAKSHFHTVTQFMQARVETILMLLVMFAVVVWFVPEMKQAAYAFLGIGAIYFLVQVLLQSSLIREVEEYERAVVFRMGHFHKISGPGWVFIVPLFESMKIVDLRVQSFDLPPQAVITSDEIRTTIDSIVYYQVIDPEKAILKVREFEQTVSGYIYAALRDIASNLTLNELYAEIEKINDIVKVKIEPLTREWGIDIIDVAITNITVPETIQDSMHRRRKAKEDWATAQYEARANKTAIEALADASKKLDDKALGYLYIKEALPKIAEGKGSKVFFPMEFVKLAENLSSSKTQHVEKGGPASALYPLALHKAGQMVSDEIGAEEEPEEGEKKEEKKKEEDA